MEIVHIQQAKTRQKPSAINRKTRQKPSAIWRQKPMATVHNIARKTDKNNRQYGRESRQSTSAIWQENRIGQVWNRRNRADKMPVFRPLSRVVLCAGPIKTAFLEHYQGQTGTRRPEIEEGRRGSYPSRLYTPNFRPSHPWSLIFARKTGFYWTLAGLPRKIIIFKNFSELSRTNSV